MDINKKQYGFMPRKGDCWWSVYIKTVCRNYRSKNKKYFSVFVDLVKAFDLVSTDLYALRKMIVPEYLEKTCISLYNVCKKYVLVYDDLSGSFLVKNCVHQECFETTNIYQYDWYLNRWSEERVFDGVKYACLTLNGRSMHKVMERCDKWKKALKR